MKGAFVGCAFAKEADNHAVCSLHFLSKRRANCHSDIAADDASGAEVAMFHVGDVHGTALALAISAGLAQHFSHHLVVVFLLGLRGLGIFVAVGMRMSMSAVCAGDHVIVAQGSHCADGHSFLSGVQMGSAFEHGFAQQVGDIVFERADLNGLAQVAEQFFFGQSLLLDHCRNKLKAGVWGRFGFGSHLM